MGEFLGHLIGLGPHKSIIDIPDGYAVLLTGILVILGWYISARQATNAFRREKANKYLLADSHPVYPILRRLSNPYLQSRTPFPTYGELQADPAQQALQKDIREALVYFEFAAADIMHGLVSERYLYVSQRSLTMNVFEQSRRYIVSVRELHKQPSAFEVFETHYIRFAYPSLSYGAKILEFVLHRPLYKPYRLIFLCHYWFGSQGMNYPSDPMQADLKDISEALRRSCQFVSLVRLVALLVIALLVGNWLRV
ncbi:hypothetical protein FJ414_24625 [Mesorhizobium sp. B3-1-6]|uniref:DUF4760 domain-containing protein n=1 Tax=Mesorhizobium sp. B3-1-6 TaxID=2589895 RepID=UPI00112BF09E|nr:hypothetical protein [Mesorhizobium sp. B3-1-6]TPI30509.1 hypothetical protein FJ414_24625 [Mesorhizobium sp. B3-1-6]